MSSGDPFAVLGLSRDADARAVKRAYAARLKATRPDEDPEGFVALRAAFERARAIAEAQARRKDARPASPSSKPEKEAEQEGDAGDADRDQARRVLRARTLARREEARTAVAEAAADRLARATQWMKAGGDADGLRAILADADDRARDDLGFDLLEVLARASDWGPDLSEWDEGWEADLSGRAARPDWLTDGTIRALHAVLPLHGLGPTDRLGRPQGTDDVATAWRANRWGEIASPVLMEAGDIDAPLPRLPVDEMRVAEIDRQNADAHGSHFDRDARRWMNMAPVPRAARDVMALLGAGPGAGRAAALAGVLDRDEVQGLDAYQELEALLRRALVEAASGRAEGRGPRPLVVPDWLDAEALELFDARYGWRDRHGRGWEAQAFDRLHRLMDRVLGPRAQAFPEYAAPAPPPPKRLPPERLPLLMRWWSLLMLYGGWRFLRLPDGWWL